MKHALTRFLTFSSLSLAAIVGGSSIAMADTINVNFEPATYVVGTINGQDGWLKTGLYDAAVSSTSIPVTFGTQSLRISDSVTSGSFGDQTFAKPLVDSVGETSATAGTFAAGTKQTHFETQFDIASASSSLQAGLHLSVSPDRGDGSRMSYLRFEDQADGIHVFFDDVTDAGPIGTTASFNETDVATISRTAHTIKLTMDVVDGAGNDVVKVYVDSSLVHTGASWEDYYRFDPEAIAEQSPRIVKTLEFRESGTATLANAGNGFLIDNLSIISSTPVVAPTTVKVTIDKFVDGVQATVVNANSASFPMKTTYSTTNVGNGTDAPFTIGPVGFNTPNPYEAVTSDMNTGANYTASEVTGGPVVGADCTAGQPYALVGYTSGTTSVAAMSATPTTTVPSFTNMQTNQTVIVWNKTCPIAPTTASVHIFKYVDGVMATALNANSSAFPMLTTFSSSNIGNATDAPFTLSPTGWGATDAAYEASFNNSNLGADYATHEVTTGPIVGEACGTGQPYALAGYSTGGTLEDAAAATSSLSAPAFTNLQSDKYVIVRNTKCPTTASLTIQKDSIGGNGTFSFTGDNGIAPFTITTASSTGSITLTNLVPGTYHITEAALAGWTQTDNECSTVTLAAGAAPICIVTNTKNVKLGEIRGTKFEDRDGDGSLRDGDHHRLSGWTIYLDTNDNGVLDSGEATSTTDKFGNYRFIGLVAGTYHVREVQQAGWIQTYPSSGKYDITLAAGKISKRDNFGNFKLGSIVGMKYNDLNGNGRKDSGEVGLAGWTITLQKVGGMSATTTTDASGNYSFTGLSAGVYKLSEVMQSTWRQTDHPNQVRIVSGAMSKRNDFGNTQKPITRRDRDSENERNRQVFGFRGTENHND